MAVLAVLMLTMLMVETLAKPVPGDWNHEINFEQDTLHPELQLHQNTASDDFSQIQQEHLQQVGQNMQQVGHNEFEGYEQNQNEQQDIEQVGHQQVGHNEEFEDFEQNQNEQQDIEQVGPQQVGHNQEFEDFKQNHNEQQDIEQVGPQQVGHNQEFQDFEQNHNEQQDIEQVGQQQVGHNQEFEDFKQNHNELQDIEQVGPQQVGHNQEFEDFKQNHNEQQDIEQDTKYLQESQGYQHTEQIGQNYDQAGQLAYDQHTPHNDNEIIQLQDNQSPVVEPRQHYEEMDTAYVTTEEPSWWKKFGHKISDTYSKAKNKANDIANKIKETVG